MLYILATFIRPGETIICMIKFLPLEEKDDIWNSIIDVAEKLGYFTEEQRREAERWDTCAVGKLFNIEKNESMHAMGMYVNETFGKELTDLGGDFAACTKRDDFKQARIIYEEMKTIRNKYM